MVALTALMPYAQQLAGHNVVALTALMPYAQQLAGRNGSVFRKVSSSGCTVE